MLYVMLWLPDSSRRESIRLLDYSLWIIQDLLALPRYVVAALFRACSTTYL
jgi:hypothetical protein